MAEYFTDGEIRDILVNSRSIDRTLDVIDFIDTELVGLLDAKGLSEEKIRKSLLKSWKAKLELKVKKLQRTREKQAIKKSEIAAKAENAESQLTTILFKTMLKERKLEKISEASSSVIHADMEFQKEQPANIEWRRRVKEYVEAEFSPAEAIKAVSKEDRTPVFTMPNFKAPELPESVEEIDPVKAVREAYGVNENEKPAISLLDQIAMKDKEIFDGPLRTSENPIKIE